MRLYYSGRLCGSLPAVFTPYTSTRRQSCIYASFAPFPKFNFEKRDSYIQSRPVHENLQIVHINLANITMRLVNSFAASAMLFTAFVPGFFAGPVESSSNALIDRASPLTQPQGSCVSPSQIDLSQSRNVGNCNWREWALCTSLAAGACFIPCDAGG